MHHTMIHSSTASMINHYVILIYTFKLVATDLAFKYDAKILIDHIKHFITQCNNDQ